MNAHSLELPAQYLPFIDKLTECLSNDSNEFNLNDFEDIELKFRFIGEQWGGMLNKTSAQFALKAQEQLENVSKELGINLPHAKNGHLEFEINEGSLELVTKLVEFINSLGSMKTRDKLILAVMVLAIAGFACTPKILEQVNKVKIETLKNESDLKKQEIESKERLETIAMLSGVEKNRYSLEAPLRHMASKMENDDQVEISGNAPITKDQLKNSLQKTKRNTFRATTHYIDNPFTILDTYTPNSEDASPSVKLLYGSDLTFKADLKLDYIQMQKFFAEYAEINQKGSVHLDLRITALIKNKKIISAEVVGLGEKRDSAISMNDAYEANLQSNSDK